MKINLNISSSSNFAPLPLGRYTIKALRKEGGSLILGSNYCWHEPAGMKKKEWNYIIEEEDYELLLKLLHQIGGEMEVEVKTPVFTTPTLNPPLPADLDEM